MLPDKFREGEGYRIPYSKMYIVFMIIFIICFGILSCWLLFASEFSRSTSAGLHGVFGRTLYDNHILIRLLGVVGLFITLLMAYVFSRVLKAERSYLIFTSDGLVISNIMPEGYSPIPWDHIEGYHITSTSGVWWKNCIILNVPNYGKYTRSWMSVHSKPNILVTMGAAKLQIVTTLLDWYIPNLKINEKGVKK